MATDCRNTPFSPARYLNERVFLVNFLSCVPPEVAPPSPLVAYSLLFSEVLDASIQARVTALYSEWQKRRHTKGFVYIFRDADDPPDVYKIGSTRKKPHQRITEWRRDLQKKETLFLVAAYKTDSCRFAEAVIHAALACEWIHNRYNRHTGHRLTEYFHIRDIDAAKHFCRAVTLHVDTSV